MSISTFNTKFMELNKWYLINSKLHFTCTHTATLYDYFFIDCCSSHKRFVQMNIEASNSMLPTNQHGQLSGSNATAALPQHVPTLPYYPMNSFAPGQYQHFSHYLNSYFNQLDYPHLFQSTVHPGTSINSFQHFTPAIKNELSTVARRLGRQSILT